MSKRASAIAKAAIRLSERERFRVVEALLSSLGEEAASQESIDAAWRAEIERRSKEIDKRKVRLLSAATVRARVRRQLRGGS